MKVSLIVPVKNEGNNILTLINSIESQVALPEETIFVDGGSTDTTLSLLQKAKEKNSSVKNIIVTEATPGKGRNIGIDAACNEWIALTDAGIILEPTWLERLINEAKTSQAPDVIYGNFEPLTNSFFERYAALVYVPPKWASENGQIRGPFIASSLLRRTVWQAVGGFPDLRAAEDLIFMRRIEAHGFRIAWAPQATAWWQLRPDLASTYRKFVLYSYHNVLAGQQRYWHYGLLKNYLPGIPFLVLSLVHHPLWLLGCIVGFLARVAKNIWIRREDRGIVWFLNPVQFVCVASIMLLIEVATFIGWGKAIWHNWKS